MVVLLGLEGALAHALCNPAQSDTTAAHSWLCAAAEGAASVSGWTVASGSHTKAPNGEGRRPPAGGASVTSWNGGNDGSDKLQPRP